MIRLVVPQDQQQSQSSIPNAFPGRGAQASKSLLQPAGVILPSPGGVNSNTICGKLLSVSLPETCCILRQPIVPSFLPYICFRKAYPDVHTSGTQQLRQKLDFRVPGSRDCQKTCSCGMGKTPNTRALLCPCSIN